MKILFLCSSLADYLYKCICYLMEDPALEIKVVHGDEKGVSPFDFSHLQSNFVQKRDIKDLAELCLTFNPDLCYVAGWMNKEYMTIARQMKKRGTKIVAAVDTPWKGSIGQRIRKLTSRILLHNTFDVLWVAGNRQWEYASRLGYAPENIIDGLYAADANLFSKVENDYTKKQLLFVGRLEEIKGVHQLYEVYNALTDKERNGWTLRIIGNGSLVDHLNPTATITVDAFVQPAELAKIASGISGFVLPSLYEPWGVVVQEFAAAGVPLIVSSEVNAGEMYVRDGVNGFVFPAGNKQALKESLIKLFDLHLDDIALMGQQSRALGLQYTHADWKARLLSVMN